MLHVYHHWPLTDILFSVPLWMKTINQSGISSAVALSSTESTDNFISYSNCYTYVKILFMLITPWKWWLLSDLFAVVIHCVCKNAHRILKHAFKNILIFCIPHNWFPLQFHIFYFIHLKHYPEKGSMDSSDCHRVLWHTQCWIPAKRERLAV